MLSNVSAFYKIPRCDLKENYNKSEIREMMADVLYNRKQIKNNMEK